MFSTIGNYYTASMYQNVNKDNRPVNSNATFKEMLPSNPIDNTTAEVILYKDAIISSHNASGASTHVYYDEASGMYKVKGKDVDGTEYETMVDITKLDPNDASRIDMIALAAHLGKSGDRSAESFLLSGRREMDEYSVLPPNEKKYYKWTSLFTKENQYDDLNYIAQSFYKAGSIDGYASVSKLLQNIKNKIAGF